MQAVYASNAKGFHLTSEAVFPAPCVRKESQNCEDKMSPITRRSRTIVFFLPSQILICCLGQLELYRQALWVISPLPSCWPSEKVKLTHSLELAANEATSQRAWIKPLDHRVYEFLFSTKIFFFQIMRKCTSGWSWKHKPRLGLLYLDWTAVNEIKHQLVSTAPCVTCPLSSDTICPFWRGLNEVRWPLTSISCPS